MPEWMSSPARGMTYLFVWGLVVVWSICAPIVGILIAASLLQHPAERIFVPLSIIATIYLTVRGARGLVWLADRALRD